jgi:hypothetical protein
MLTEKGRWRATPGQVERLGFTSYKGANQKSRADGLAATRNTKRHKEITKQISRILIAFATFRAFRGSSSSIFYGRINMQWD